MTGLGGSLRGEILGGLGCMASGFVCVSLVCGAIGLCRESWDRRDGYFVTGKPIKEEIEERG